MRGSFKFGHAGFGCRSDVMNHRASLWVAAPLALVTLLAGCHGDPNVRKQKYVESGVRYSGEGKYNEAIIQFSNALKIDKNYPEAHYQLAETYLHINQYSGAYAELSRAVSLQPSNMKARLELGRLLVAGGKLDDAQAQADAIMAAQPNNPDLYALRSSIAFKHDDKVKALAEMHRALELDPNRSAFHEELALLQSKDPNSDASVEVELKKSIALDPKAVNPKLLLASLYAGKGRWPEAEQVTRDAIAADPKDLQARETLAQLFLRQNNQAKAEEELRRMANDLVDNPQAIKGLADYYERTGQPQKSQADFAGLAAKNPKNLPVQEAYVRALLEVKDYATARTVVANMMKKSAKDPQVLALNGIVLLNDGKPSDAVHALQDAAKNYPNDPFLQLWLGKAALATGDSTLAEKSFREAARLAPSQVESQAELARLAAQHGDMDLLTEVANKTIAAAPRFPNGYVWRAAAEMSRKEIDKAEADLKTALTVAPQSPAAHLELGRLRLAQKRFPEAQTALEQVLQSDPNSVEALRLLVAYDLYQKQPDKALARVNAQIGKSPNNSSFYDLLAQLQIQSKNLDQASATAQKAIQLNASDAEALMLYAQIQIRRGQTGNAIVAWQNWNNTHPNDANAIAILGTLEEATGSQQKAEADYKRALQIQSQQPVAANNLAYMMLQNGENADVALTLAQTARRAMPNSASAADTLAWAYYHKGIYSFARDLLEEAVKTDATNATMQYHLGMVYSKLSDKSNATTHLKMVISLAPDSPTAKDAKTALQGL